MASKKLPLTPFHHSHSEFPTSIFNLHLSLNNKKNPNTFLIPFHPNSSNLYPNMLPEKSIHPSWVLQSKIQWSFRVLMLAVVLGLIIFWGFNVNDFHKDFITKFDTKIVNNLNITTPKKPSFNSSQSPAEPPRKHSPTKPLNLTGKVSDPASFNWVSVELESNYSSSLLSRWLAAGGEPCKDSTTEDISIQDLDDRFNRNNKIELSAGEIHEFDFQTLDSAGNRRCLGGDYFELDFSGDTWKSRPPVKDFGNGKYSFSLQVHPDFIGDYNLTIILLFRHYQGLKFSPERFAVDKILRVFQITFINSSSILPEIKQCKKSDFEKNIWSGRWTRPMTRPGNRPELRPEWCPISNDGRFRCLKRNYRCKDQWCDGDLSSLESNGWVYSAHCSFKLFDSDSAWNCLNNRWLFFWGDSNHCDTIRNLLNFYLNYEISTVPRLFDMNITNPRNSSQSFRVTNVFNGHYNHTGNYQGLNSLNNEGYRDYLRSYFSGEVVPDTIVMNSGLHDGVYWPNLRRFIKGARDAAAFWAEVIGGVRRRKVAVPVVVYRTTVATGGYARRLVFNPSKMEAFNGVFVDKLREFGLIDRLVDHFDMTYPWHFDNRCNDGVHYGRAPAKMRWRDGQIGHQYFVDLMLCQVLLNVLCSR